MHPNPHMPAIAETLEQALKQWHHEDTDMSLDGTLPHLVRQVKATWPGSQLPSGRQFINQFLLKLLEMLAARDTEGAMLLRRRYIDDEIGFSVANSLGISESAFYRRRRDALLALAEVAWSCEQEAKAAWLERLERRLDPPSYHQLFGLANLRARLHQLLTTSRDIRIICLTGIGGIGKTALADALARQVIAGSSFDELTWVSARQQQFALWGEIQAVQRPALTAAELALALEEQLGDGPPELHSQAEILAALKARLAHQSHLIILDNLETALDHQELFPLLHELSRDAKILVTSRFNFHEQPDIYTVNLAELAPADAEQLIRDEARRRGITDLAEAPAERITDIYEVAGGNPLALKLIVGQVQVRSLPVVLDDLREARGRRIEALYEYIYLKAWKLLDDVARQVLLAMPLVAFPGTTLEHLAGTTGLEADDLYEALELLIRLSLVNAGGSLEERRYSIHRLTETFLHKQVTEWD